LEVAPGWTEASPRESKRCAKPIRAGDAHVGILIVSLGFWSGLFVKATKDKAGIRSMFPVFHRDENYSNNVLPKPLRSPKIMVGFVLMRNTLKNIST